MAVGVAAWLLFFGRGSENAVSLGQPPQQAAATQTAQATGNLSRSRSLEVWFVRHGRLVEALRTHRSTPGVATAALEALLTGPTRAERRAGLTTKIPRGTRPLGVTIANGVARVDLSSDFEAGAGAGSLQLRLAQVVYTLTQFPTVKAVRFELDGSPVDVFSSSGIVLDHPVGRNAYKSLGPVVPPQSGAWQRMAPAPIAAPNARASVWTGRELLRAGPRRGRDHLRSLRPEHGRLAPPEAASRPAGPEPVPRGLDRKGDAGLASRRASSVRSCDGPVAPARFSTRRARAGGGDLDRARADRVDRKRRRCLPAGDEQLAQPAALLPSGANPPRPAPGPGAS